MTEFVASILVYVGRHVAIQGFQGGLKSFVTQSQFIVLLPEVGLENFSCRQELKEGGVTT